VAVLALHTSAIDLSKEFKPYSVSLFLHVTLLTLALKYLETERVRDLVLALLVAVCGLLWAQDLVMAYPGLFLVLGWHALKRHPRRLFGVGAAAAAIAALLIVQYVFVWSQLASNESEYWGAKYHVFYSKSAHTSYLAWLLDVYQDVAAFPGYRRESWDASWLGAERLAALRRIDAAVWLLIEVGGAVSLLLRRRFRDAVLLLAPFVTQAALNVAGLWPAGVFRTNLFLVGYTAAIACISLDGERARVVRWPAVVPALVLVVLPLVLLDRSWNARKLVQSSDTDAPIVMRLLVKAEPPRPTQRVPLLLSKHLCAPYDYYAHYHAKKARFAAPFEERYEVKCVRNTEDLRAAAKSALRELDHAFWISDLDPVKLTAVETSLPEVAWSFKSSTMPDRLVELTSRHHKHKSAL